MPVISVYNEVPGVVFLKFPFNREVIEEVKRHHGKSWDAARAGWKFPEVALKDLRLPAGWKLLDTRKVDPVKTEALTRVIAAGLHPYQTEGIEKAIKTGGQLFAWEMGLGKTRGAIELAKSINAKRILVVCPSSVRPVWKDQLALWWPERLDDLQILATSVESKKPGKNYTREIRYSDSLIAVCSFDLAGRMPVGPWDMIIVDESAYIKGAILDWNWKFKGPKRAQIIQQLRDASPRGFVLELTGTPATEPHELFFQLNLIGPRAFGHWYQWVRRYSIVTASEYSKFDQVYGIAEGREEELKSRISPFIHRATLKEWGHLLPPLRTHRIEVKRKGKRVTAAEIFDDNHRLHEQRFASFLMDAADVKIPAAIEWAEQTDGRACILTYNTATAEEIARRLGDRAILVTGYTHHAGVRKEAASSIPEGMLLVASMKSIETGLDLSYINRVLFAEIYWSPILMLQVMKRFHRLNSKTGVDIYFLTASGSMDDLIAQSLSRRTDDIGRAIGQDQAGESLLAGVAPKIDADWQDKFFEMAKQAEKDGY